MSESSKTSQLQQAIIAEEEKYHQAIKDDKEFDYVKTIWLKIKKLKIQLAVMKGNANEEENRQGKTA